jgi:hypothetical protein
VWGLAGSHGHKFFPLTIQIGQGQVGVLLSVDKLQPNIIIFPFTLRHTHFSPQIHHTNAPALSSITPLESRRDDDRSCGLLPFFRSTDWRRERGQGTKNAKSHARNNKHVLMALKTNLYPSLHQGSGMCSCVRMCTCFRGAFTGCYTRRTHAHHERINPRQRDPRSLMTKSQTGVCPSLFPCGCLSIGNFVTSHLKATSQKTCQERKRHMKHMLPRLYCKNVSPEFGEI